MCMKVFFAGASGAIGQRLLPMLLERGYQVLAISRSAQRAATLESAGARAMLLDVYDAPALHAALLEFQPRWVIHQLTDLPAGLEPALMPAAQSCNARVRREGTANLVAAARAAGVERMVAQSIAWAYAPGELPLHEEQPLDLGAEGPRAVSVGGVAALEEAVLGARPMEGIVLRYGRLYGPGTGTDMADPRLAVHVDDAARAALLALEWGAHGVYNVAEQDIDVSSAKARHRLGWQPGFRLAGLSA
ncbi:NAD(P)-dependent oxidoreductase [Pseudomonas nicosulfuronedens]|uniref:NAD(P)-dependent oxidoreductase n=1 Tax=Pseudomonas nicosulfuronedens TaxID=2571105 RepID=A0A5R9QQJ9_9PSED|nr:NAD(P)-dependent oxidoreductase [Pseudomonas nicosulfuronedens]MDH1008425.1 NAD(P)-dependent oxidoreductase [Pseudomonas nicosulfuronedens]MDH1979383.1 NAD(P)-dependent oxidoreductase [Pseudomonas nicosulfuronedens]MDH2027169.1 NAD(P)-dependent oxidoreductase [Pseudomonas nicosulfuronedens]TLX72068.1 NAD(P)-dependent oxidoreductase [Pseudomonas nicosulfuronedens]